MCDEWHTAQREHVRQDPTTHALKTCELCTMNTSSRMIVQMPQQAARTMWVLATIFLRANTSNQPIRKRDHIWKKPGVGVVKINVDASFHADNFT